MDVAPKTHLPVNGKVAQGGSEEVFISTVLQHSEKGAAERDNHPLQAIMFFWHLECDPIKVTFKRLELRCSRSITSSRHPSQLDLDKLVFATYHFWSFLIETKQSRIKRS